MIKKKNISQEDINTWKSYIKSPTGITDKDNIQNKDEKNNDINLDDNELKNSKNEDEINQDEKIENNEIIIDNDEESVYSLSSYEDINKPKEENENFTDMINVENNDNNGVVKVGFGEIRPTLRDCISELRGSYTKRNLIFERFSSRPFQRRVGRSERKILEKVTACQRY